MQKAYDMLDVDLTQIQMSFGAWRHDTPQPLKEGRQSTATCCKCSKSLTKLLQAVAAEQALLQTCNFECFASRCKKYCGKLICVLKEGGEST